MPAVIACSQDGSDMFGGTKDVIPIETAVGCYAVGDVATYRSTRVESRTGWVNQHYQHSRVERFTVLAEDVGGVLLERELLDNEIVLLPGSDPLPPQIPLLAEAGPRLPNARIRIEYSTGAASNGVELQNREEIQSAIGALYESSLEEPGSLLWPENLRRTAHAWGVSGLNDMSEFICLFLTPTSLFLNRPRLSTTSPVDIANPATLTIGKPLDSTIHITYDEDLRSPSLLAELRRSTEERPEIRKLARRADTWLDLDSGWASRYQVVLTTEVGGVSTVKRTSFILDDLHSQL